MGGVVPSGLGYDVLLVLKKMKILSGWTSTHTSKSGVLKMWVWVWLVITSEIPTNKKQIKINLIQTNIISLVITSEIYILFLTSNY